MHWAKFELLLGTNSEINMTLHSVGKSDKAQAVLQGALETSSLHRNPQILSAIEVLKITGKLNVASVLTAPSDEGQKKNGNLSASQASDETNVVEGLQYSQLQTDPGASQAHRRDSINSVASVAVPRISPSDVPSSAVLSTATRLRRLGLGPPKRAMMGSESQSALSPVRDSKVPRNRLPPSGLAKSISLDAEEPLIPTPPRQTLRHQLASLEASPLSTISRARLNYTGSPLTSGIGAEDEDDDAEDDGDEENEDPGTNLQDATTVNEPTIQEKKIRPNEDHQRLSLGHQPPQSNPVNSSQETQVKTRAVRINGRTYRVLHLIGKGGSSKVFKVLAPDNQVLALKKVSLRNVDDTTLSGYVNEIELLKRLGNEENIIRLVDAELNRAHASLYIVMEYGEVDLSQLLRERAEGPRDYNFIRYCWQQMLQAVRVVHAAKVVHCDLKPANFLLVKGRLKLIDFGISKAIMNDTTNIVRENQVGTVNYMSPEALQESSGPAKGLIKIGRPSDVWSLGCILYEMTFGRAPFASYSLIQRLQKIMDDTHQIPFPPSDNPALVDAIQGCLQRQVSKRLTIDALLRHPFLMPHLQTVARPVAMDLQEALERLPTEARAILEASLRHL